MKSTKDTTATPKPEREVQAGELTLNTVSVKEAGRTLSSLYTDRRKNLMGPFASMVRDELLYNSPLSATKLKVALGDIRRGANLSETLETQLYNSFGGDLRNALAVAKADKRYDDAWRRIINSLEVSNTDISKQLGREIIVEDGYGWKTTYYPELLFNFLKVTDFWKTYSLQRRLYDTHAMLSLDVITRQELSDLFFGKEYRQPHLTLLPPKEENLTIDNFEAATASDLLVLNGVALNGSILSDNGSISASAVKKVKKQVQMLEFSESAAEWQVDRVEMLCLTYFSLLARRLSHSPIRIIDLAKFGINNMPQLLAGPMFYTFIPAMQGFTKSWTVSNYASKVASIVESLLLDAKDEWMSLDNFRIRLLCYPFEGNINHNILNLFPLSDREKGKAIRRSEKEHARDLRWKGEPINWFEEVGFNFAIHWVKYLCALGMVELAMESDIARTTDDPMEGMRYARLTSLGRYIFGIDKTYTPKAAERSDDIEFDAKNGILTIDAKSPFQMFLATVAKRISPTRFHISEKTLISSCRTKAELDQRIKNLSVIIDPETHPAIQAIIDEALRHTYCAQLDGGYSLLRLRPDLPGLRETILADKELREMSIFAGPSLVLVKTYKLDRFNTLCASYGYLME